MFRIFLGIAAWLPFLAAAALVQPGAPAPLPEQKKLPADADPAEEAFIHTPAGFRKEGRPTVAEGNQAGVLQLQLVDAADNKPTFCRVNVVGSDGNYYEPADHPLAPWSLHRLGNRPGKGPSRYYGWPFYCAGEATVRVPAGPVRVEVWKGYESCPATVRVDVAAGAQRSVTIPLRRTLSMADHGYYSGDTHIHFRRQTPADEERAFDLLAAEDVAFGFLLCMNDPKGYTGIMARQEWPQERGFGPTSVVQRGRYSIASGQEYRCGTYGHICLVMHGKLVQEQRTVDPNNWPVFGLIGRETRALGGYSFHAHGGYAQEIYVDFAQRATDAVELLQFAEYRGIGLHGWYRMLNTGFRFPSVGACDYPYCRALADCRTYVHSSQRPTPAEWARRAAEGYSFFTTGPMLLLEVEGQAPGATLRLRKKGPHSVRVRLRVGCEVTPVAAVELIVNGATVRRLAVPRTRRGEWTELEHTLQLTEPSWIAARASSTGPTGKPDAEAHTNPVYVYLANRAPYRREDLDWLVERVDDKIAAVKKRTFAEQAQVLEFFSASKDELLRVREAGGQHFPIK